MQAAIYEVIEPGTWKSLVLGETWSNVQNNNHIINYIYMIKSATYRKKTCTKHYTCRMMWQKVSQPVDPMFRQSWVATFLIVSKMSRGTPIFLGQCTGKSCAKAYGFVSKYGNYRKTRWFKVFQSHVSHCLMVIWGTGHFQTHQNIIYQVGIIRLKYPCYLIIPVTSLGSFRPTFTTVGGRLCTSSWFPSYVNDFPIFRLPHYCCFELR
jgi:hypothetical protein